MSLERLLEHRQIWREKPGLARAYGVWFASLLETIGTGARVLEVGAGPGLLSEHAHLHRPDVRWIASDVLGAPWNDLVTDGSQLPFAGGSFDAITAVDLIHHLARPAAFFSEAARVLRPGGHVAAVEPWVTPFSYPIYRFLHQEGCRLRLDPWAPFPDGEAKDAFEGDSGVVWRLVKDTLPGRWKELGFRPPHVALFNGFEYLATLGFRPASLLPLSLAGALGTIDRVTRWLAPVLAVRGRILWERVGGERTAD